jgi:hypothetical protein
LKDIFPFVPSPVPVPSPLFPPIFADKGIEVYANKTAYTPSATLDPRIFALNSNPQKISSTPVTGKATLDPRYEKIFGLSWVN